MIGRRLVCSIGLCMGLWLLPATARGGLGVLNYNVKGIGPAGSEGREALQRIVDYFDPDVIVFQEAQGTTYPEEFLAANGEYEGFYSSADGAQNRRMIMSRYDILDESVREYDLGEGSLRTLLGVTIDLPAPQDLEVFTAHWHASSAAVRANESAASVDIVESHRSSHPGSWYIYAGDFNDTDNCSRITDLLEPGVGLELYTPVDPNNGSNATINSDPSVGTYLDRRIDYILPCDVLAWYGLSGRVLNTWSYTSETIPAPLELSDTISASDHLPIYAWFDVPVGPGGLPGDANADGVVNGGDYTIWADNYLSTGLPGASEGGWYYGNFNEDTVVNGGDYTIWADNYDRAGGSRIPAPASLVLLGAGGIAVLRRRRKLRGEIPVP